MEQYQIDELIDHYLQGTISPGNNQKLKELIATDNEVAKHVEESKLAYQALEIERRKRLKTKLKSIDKTTSRPWLALPRWLILIILALGGCFMYLYIASIYFSPNTIAGKNYITLQDFMADQKVSGAIDQRWINADEDFKKGAYQKSIQQFASIAEKSEPMVSTVAKWNILVAELAMYGPNEDWRKRLAAFEKTAPPSLAIKAGNLQELIDSRFYRFFFIRLQDNLSTIKPRLI